MVTLAPDTAVRCASPDARKSAVVWPDTADVSPSTRAGRIEAWSAGRTRRADSAKPARTRCAARSIADASPSVGRPAAVSTATVRSRRRGRSMRARKPAGRPAVTSANPAADPKTTTRPDISSPSSSSSAARNISRPAPTGRGLSVGVTMTVAEVPYRVTNGCSRRSSTRRPIATVNPAPTTTPPRTAPMPAVAAGAARARAQRAAPAVAAATVSTAAAAAPTPHRMPAAVAAHPLTAAGTSRTSNRSPLSSGVTPGPGHAASPAVPARCRRPRQADPPS